MHSIHIVKQTESKLLVGISIELSIKNNNTGELWRNFIPRIKEIQNKSNALKPEFDYYLWFRTLGNSEVQLKIMK